MTKSSFFGSLMEIPQNSCGYDKVLITNHGLPEEFDKVQRLLMKSDPKFNF